MRQLKPFHLLSPHREDCAMFGDRNYQHTPWCCPEHTYMDLRREKDKPLSFSRTSPVLLFQCSDIQCGAKLAVRMEYAEERLGLNRFAVRMFGWNGKPLKNGLRHASALPKAGAQPEATGKPATENTKTPVGEASR